MCFGAEYEIMYIFWYIYVLPAKTYSASCRDRIVVLFISTAPFEDTQFPLPQHKEH